MKSRLCEMWKKLPGIVRRAVVPLMIYAVVAAAIGLISGGVWENTPVEMTGVTPSKYVNVAAGSTMRQEFTFDGDTLSRVNFGPVGGAAPVKVEITSEGSTVWAGEVAADVMQLGQMVTLEVDCPSEGVMALEVTPQSDGFSVGCGTTISAAKIEIEDKNGVPVTIDGAGIDGGGKLAIRISGHKHSNAVAVYWCVAAVIFLLLAAVLFLSEGKRRKYQENLLIRAENLVTRYSYLLRQLVKRDFKVKYKGSMLGMLWSLLNPLLTTGVYYFVFSQVFKSNIENFPIYLVSGVIIFNYFSESTSSSMTSVVGNASLLTKVYIPKYILPLSKTVSSGINLLISLVPMFLMMIITGCRFTPALLLLPVLLVLLWGFCFGMSLMLSSANVFFRDTQFLWSVVCMMWNFLTPIFYPVSIIPDKFRAIYDINPLAHMVAFARSICMTGCAPSPEVFTNCVIYSVAVLMLGLVVFRKTQSKFMMHL